MDCKNVIFGFFFIALVHYSAAQPQLVLLKGDKVVTRFVEGDYIRFKRKDREHFTAGLIGGMTKDYFRIGEDTTFIHQLEKIDIHDRITSGINYRNAGITLMIAGGVLLLGDLINETLVNDETYSPNAGVLTASGILIGTGILLQFVNNDIFKMSRRKHAVVIEK